MKNACLTTSATVFLEIFRRLQYADSIHISSNLTPLLELQERQQRQMFSRLTKRASLMMCSQFGRFPTRPSATKTVPQYTHALSRIRTSRSSQSGMFQRFIGDLGLVRSLETAFDPHLNHTRSPLNGAGATAFGQTVVSQAGMTVASCVAPPSRADCADHRFVRVAHCPLAPRLTQ